MKGATYHYEPDEPLGRYRRDKQSETLFWKSKRPKIAFEPGSYCSSFCSPAELRTRYHAAHP